MGLKTEQKEYHLRVDTFHKMQLTTYSPQPSISSRSTSDWPEKESSDHIITL